jgi:RNA polymerase sigma-70 factor (ECF subfamily)
MSDSSDLTILLNEMKGGDDDAREKVIAATAGRLERLARKMLRSFPSVKRWEDTLDVLQNALIRLDRALRAVAPTSSREFFGLAAEQIRRELIDLARHYTGPHGHGKNHQSGHFVGDAAKDGLQPVAPGTESDELEKWAAFHEAVADLPVAEREVFMLAFYHKWTHAQIAELFQIDERTVRRRWRASADLLSKALGGQMPGG